jgi:hypothetical protein
MVWTSGTSSRAQQNFDRDFNAYLNHSTQCCNAASPPSLTYDSKMTQM